MQNFKASSVIPWDPEPFPAKWREIAAVAYTNSRDKNEGASKCQPAGVCVGYGYGHRDIGIRRARLGADAETEDMDKNLNRAMRRRGQRGM